MSVTLYGFPPSTFTQTCLIALTEKGVSYELAMVDIRGADYGRIHPFQKVPALEHDGKRVFEALAIVDYVDQVFEGPPLIPRELAQRIATLEWISAFLDYFAKTVLEMSVRERFAKPLMGMSTDEDLIQSHVAEMQRVTKILDNQLGRNVFVAGAVFGAADMFFAPVYLYFRKTPEGRSILGRCGNVARWMDTIGIRNSIQATSDVIEQLLPE